MIITKTTLGKVLNKIFEESKINKLNKTLKVIVIKIKEEKKQI